MAFSVSPSVIDVGSLSSGQVVDTDVVFVDVPSDITGGGTVTFDLGGTTFTVNVGATIDNPNVTQGAIAIDPAFGGEVTIIVLNLTNAGATIRVARA